MGIIEKLKKTFSGEKHELSIARLQSLRGKEETVKVKMYVYKKVTKCKKNGELI